MLGVLPLPEVMLAPVHVFARAPFCSTVLNVIPATLVYGAPMQLLIVTFEQRPLFLSVCYEIIELLQKATYRKGTF